jgi:23S rRNA pseudouridine1911/1915/1917 synthase
VRINKANTKISSGTTIKVLSRADGDQKERNKKNILEEPDILFCDNEIIVANKPEGLLSVATDRGESDTMYDRVSHWASQNLQKRIFLIHRLDRETSGCMIFTTTQESKNKLQSQFKSRTIERIYHAVVFSKPQTKSGTESIRIQETKDKRVRLVIGNKRAGKEAITHWEIERTGPVNSLLRIKIDTGRRAQIRLHMANINCPVLGDTRYGRGKTSVNRLCLHASELTFQHPNGEEIHVSSPIPKKLISELNRKSL